MLSQIVWVENVYPYADTLGWININYYDKWQWLDWHYDNCNFVITLLIKKAKTWWIYQYFPNNRYKENWKENYEEVEQMVEWRIEPKMINLDEATMVIFRWTESLHRVTPVEDWQRVLVTFCYNLKSWVSLSEVSRKTFFWRID